MNNKIILKAYKYRLYPTDIQKSTIHQIIGCSRYVYNYFLSLWDITYKETNKGLSYNKCSAMLTELKKSNETSWLCNSDSIALQSSLRDLDSAFSRFFKKQSKYPRFKSKKNPIQSYTTKNTNNNINININTNNIVNSKIKLPKLGYVKIKYSNEIPSDGIIKRATIRYTSSGRYYVSVLCEISIKPLEPIHKSVGIDLGITDFAILSNGERYKNNRFTKKMENKLKREQKKLSRRYKQAVKSNKKLHEAKNYQKQRKVVAKLHEKIANQREDFLNKLSTYIIKNHDIICIEDLHIKGLLKNKKLAKSISDVSWSKFVQKLLYKATWYGRMLIKIPRFYPSSQICHVCNTNSGKKPLEIREWQCKNCLTVLDRDINAAKNIQAKGLSLLAI